MLQVKSPNFSDYLEPCRSLNLIWFRSYSRFKMAPYCLGNWCINPQHTTKTNYRFIEKKIGRDLAYHQARQTPPYFSYRVFQGIHFFLNPEFPGQFTYITCIHNEKDIFY